MRTWWGIAVGFVAVTAAGCSTKDVTATPAPPAAPDAQVDASTAPEAQRVTLPWGDLYVTSKLDDAGRVERVAFRFPMATALPTPRDIAPYAAAGGHPRGAVDMPDEVARQTIFSSIAFGYMPTGMKPLGVYDSPLWDIHTSIRKEADVQAIDCQDKTVPQLARLPENYIYVPPPDNCVPTMGIHAVDTTAPEFNKARLTLSHNLTFYGGIYNGHVLLVARTFLQTSPNGTFRVPVARIPERPGVLTPTTLDVSSDTASATVTFTYKDFVPAPL